MIKTSTAVIQLILAFLCRRWSRLAEDKVSRLIQGFLGCVGVASLALALSACAADEAQVASPDEWLARELVPPELPVSTQNQLSLHGLFTDGMVLQRDVPIPVWGWGPEGAAVRVYFANNEITTKVQGNCWSVRLPAVQASKEARILTVVCGSRYIALKDVVVGDVWLCSGQSNMECEMKLDVAGYPRRKADIDKTSNQDIRFFKVDRGSSRAPRRDVPSIRNDIYAPWSDSFLGNQWRPCIPEWSPHVAAMAFYFATELQPRLGCPLGIIICARGATSIAHWVPSELIKAEPCWNGFRESLNRAETHWSEFAQPSLASLREFTTKYPTMDVLYKAQTAPNHKPISHPGQLTWPSCFYNGMLHAMAPFALKGVAWYQGEGDAGNPAYADMLASMINNWRGLWQQPDLPFVIAQLAGYGDERPSTGESPWAELRECQARVPARVPHTAVAVLFDAGMRKNIHPVQKEIAGARLALVARKEVYGEAVAAHGPTFQTLAREGNALVVTFAHTENGLVAKGVNLDGVVLPAGKLEGFAVAGADRKFIVAEARIDGKRVLVENSLVPEPVAVRYAWADFPIANLYNSVDLPACPFRAELAPAAGK